MIGSPPSTLLALACLSVVGCRGPVEAPLRAPLRGPDEVRVRATDGAGAPGAPDALAETPVAGAPEPLEVRLWRAGRPIPPGLAATRASEVEAARARAGIELRRTLTPEERARLAAWLEDPATPRELWAAAARCVVVLEAYDLAARVARALAPEADLARGAAARTSLHALYGRWFRNPEEVAPFLAAVEGGPGTRLLVGALLEEEARSRERLLAELELRPAGAAAWLADPDPAVRSGAARVLARSLAGGGGEAAPLAALVAHLEGEPDARAFHEALLACTAPLERMEVDHAVSLRLRALLVDLARAGGEPRALTLAQVLARLPWRTSGARDLGHVLTAVDALGALARALTAAERARGTREPDALVAVLASTRQLCGVARAGGLRAELRGGTAREGLLALLLDEAQDDAVRAAAAAALGLQAEPADALELARVLSDPGSPAAVRLALLGALGEILPELGPQAGRAELAQALASQIAAADADLRRRALALLAEPGLEPVARALEGELLAARLAAETNREALLALLALIGRYGPPSVLAPALAAPSLEGLCCDPGLLETLVPALAAVARRGTSGLVALAERLASVRCEATRLQCLRHALALAAELSEAQVHDLSPAQHAAISSWVWLALRAGVGPRELPGVGGAFARRVVEVHLPHAAGAGAIPGGLGAFESTHLAAVLRAELCLSATGEKAPARPAVESAFEESFARAPDTAARWLVLRDRARFRAAAGEGVKALADYRRLVEAGPEAEALLAIPDLRAAFALLGRLDVTVGEGKGSSASEACALLTRIVLRPEWQAEPAAVRLKDLQDWVRASLAEGRPESLRRIEEALADLPQIPGETRSERVPPPLWLGLSRESDSLRTLLDLRAQVRARLGEASRG